MKASVSLPDQLFHQADQAARRMRLSRSQLYAIAMEEFLRRHDDDSVTQKLNEVYTTESSALDPAVHEAQLASIDNRSWWKP